MKEILNKTCRLCLATDAQDKTLIFVPITEEQKGKFEELTGIQLLLDDMYPLNSCTNCSDLLENFFFYKHQLVRKQKDLMDFLNKLTQQQEQSKPLENYDEIEFLDEILEEQFNKSDEMLTTFDEYDPSAQSNDLNDDEINFVYREELQYESNEPQLILHPNFQLSDNLTGTFLIGIEESTDQVDPIRQFICNFCGNIYHNRKAMRSHLRSHNQQKRFKCLSCDKAFRYQHHLKNHNRIHTKSSPFQCDQCDSSFRQNYALKIHKKKHSKTFLECNLCKSQFVMQSQLSKHEKKRCDGIFRPYVVRTRKIKKSNV